MEGPNMNCLKQLSVLYAEDHAPTRTWFGALLAQRVGELRLAADGRQALALLQEAPCDLLMTDLCMPGMGGIELCRQARLQWPELSVIILSVVDEREQLLETLNLGVDGYLLKPLDVTRLDQVLMRAAERFRARKELERSEARYRLLFAGVNDPLFVYPLTVENRPGLILEANDAACTLFGYSHAELRQMRLPQLCSGGSPCDEDACIRHLLACESCLVERDLVCKDGRIIPTELSCRFLPVDDGIQVVTTVRDITPRRRHEELLRYTATHDPLTGLFNRAYFEAERDRLIRGRTTPVSVLMADLDGLKLVNDQHGHQAGDSVLRQAAQLLLAACRASDVVARIGGDEFYILLPGVDAPGVASVMERIRRLMAAPQGGRAVALSLGCATCDDPSLLDQALDQADRNMYADKAVRRKRLENGAGEGCRPEAAGHRTRRGAC